jgi:hypothetical protein
MCLCYRWQLQVVLYCYFIASLPGSKYQASSRHQYGMPFNKCSFHSLGFKRANCEKTDDRSSAVGCNHIRLRIRVQAEVYHLHSGGESVIVIHSATVPRMARPRYAAGRAGPAVLKSDSVACVALYRPVHRQAISLSFPFLRLYHAAHQRS